jgi:hypothetical protein
MISPAGGPGTPVAVPVSVHRTLRSAVAAITASGLVSAAGCGGAAWPNRAVGVSTVSFAHHELDISRIDVLPLDLQVWAAPGHTGDLDETASAAGSWIMNAALDTLARRNYGVGAVIDRNGIFDGGTALSHGDLDATLGALERYGAAAASRPGQLPVPYLPARLGTATGSEATLYVGGWAYVAGERESTAEQVGKVVLFTLAIITVVAIVVALADSHHGSSHGSSGSHHGGGGGTLIGGGHHGGHGGFHAARALDAFGRAAVDIALTAPDWSEDTSLPHDGEQSQMYLEMTLVDNRTGLALWHAHQTFPAELGRGDDVARAMHTLLALLPPHAAIVARP